MRLKAPLEFAPAIALMTVLLLGLTLRFWHLDTKPLWLDEVLTALFTTGHRSANLPLNQFLPLSAIDSIFAYQPGLSCAQIAQTVATDSVHPPLFFCLMYQWLGWLKPDAVHWIWAMRALPALFGVGAIAALYHLNRLAFSPAAGWMGAALMAVSPFAVYLSQEGRHYTLPMLLITLALAGLLQIQQDLAAEEPRLRSGIWLGWTGLNLLSLYVHYFSILAIVAQVVALLGWIVGRRLSLSRRQWGAIALATTGISLGYLPWLPTMLSHIQRPETDWLIPYNPNWLDRLAPLYQTLVGWTLMFIALPVERQPQPIALLSVVLTLAFVVWLGRRLYLGFRQLWSSGNPAIALLGGFTLCVIIEFLAIAYVLNKDITVVPRYNFIYYPGVCALAGACLARSSLGKAGLTLRRSGAIVLLVGLISSLFVVNGGAFLKSYAPDRVAKNIAEPGLPIAIGVAYSSLQEVALGLSFALELRHLYPQPEDSVQIAFIDKTQGYQRVWKTLAELRQPLPLPLNLWVVASPGMRSKDYPDRLRIFDPENPQRRAKISCAIDPEGYYRIGFPYQLFRCLPK